MLKSRSEIAAVIDRYVELLRQQGVEVERVYLYGSYLRGTQNEWSDVDVIVVSPTWRGMGIWDRAGVTGQARGQVFDEMGESIEPLTRTPEEVANRLPASFLADVLKDAEIVYERTPARA